MMPDGEQGTGELNEPSVYILDTTLREGELNPSVYYTSGMLETLGLALARLGTPRIEYSVTYPQRGGNIRDLRNIISTLQGSYEDVVPVIQCRALAADIDTAQELGARGCGIYIAISQEHRRFKLNGISLEKVINRIEESLSLLKEYGFKYRRAVLEDASRFFTQYKGEEDTRGTFRTLIETADRAGATVVSIPDTAGMTEEELALCRRAYAAARSLELGR
jgi:isopropylmalate/homocitrate/citramalate synthase